MVNPFDAVLASRSGKRKGGDAPKEEKKKKRKRMTSERRSEEEEPVVGDELRVTVADGSVILARVVKVKESSEKGRRYNLVDLATKVEHRLRLKRSDWVRSKSAYLRLLDRGGAKIIAPMVGGSELAFRLLCRRYGAEVGYTPMMHADAFVNDEAYRRTWLQTNADDGPLVAHFCANDPEILGLACKVACEENEALSGVDLNLGCPQRVAYSGHFGSYLLGDDDRELVKKLVSAMRNNVPRQVAVCVKIRLLDSKEATFSLVNDLKDAGAQVVAVHARKRATWHKKGPGARDGPANLSAVKDIVDEFKDDLRIVTNGNVRPFKPEEVEAALETTGARGVMCAEGLLNDPKLFHSEENKESLLSRLDLALEYLTLVSIHGNPAGYRSIAFHVRRLCGSEAFENYDLLDSLLDGSSLEDASKVVHKCRAFAAGDLLFVADPEAKKRAKDRKKNREATKLLRRQFEERMARKAKRLQKPLDFFLKDGATPPTPDEIDAIRQLPTNQAQLDHWKQHFPQVCFQFTLQSDCKRGDTCAFLHARADAEHDVDTLVSG